MADRNRACINCDHRELWNAGSRCDRDGHYVSYCATWDEVCRYWAEVKRKPGEIEVYEETEEEPNEEADH